MNILITVVSFQTRHKETLVGKTSAYMAKGKYTAAFRVLIASSKVARSSIATCVKETARKEMMALSSMK